MRAERRGFRRAGGAAAGLQAVLVLAWACGATAVADERPADLGPAEGEPAAREAAPQAKPAVRPAAPAGEAKGASGRIELTLTPVESAKKVWLVEREKNDRRPAVRDAQTGGFTVEGLSAGTWTVEIETAWGRIEGVDMRYRPGDAKSEGQSAGSGQGEAKPQEEKAAEASQVGRPAAPQESNAPRQEPAKALSDEDRAEITKHISGAERFMTPRILLWQGDGRRATVLVSLVREGDFHGRQGDEVVWRLEAWYYQNPWGTWERSGSRVIFRERVRGAVFRSWSRQFEPGLGGLEVKADSAAAVKVSYVIPERPDASCSLMGVRGQ